METVTASFLKIYLNQGLPLITTRRFALEPRRPKPDISTRNCNWESGGAEDACLGFRVGVQGLSFWGLPRR